MLSIESEEAIASSHLKYTVHESHIVITFALTNIFLVSTFQVSSDMFTLNLKQISFAKYLGFKNILHCCVKVICIMCLERKIEIFL